MRRVQKYFCSVLLALGLQGVGLAAVWTVSPWTDDASTGIDSAKTYTHAINFSDGSTTTVNGVPITASGGSHSGTTWSYSGGGLWFYNADDSNNFITGDSVDLGRDFEVPGGNGYTQLQLTGLTPNAVYEITLFSTGWDSSGDRVIRLTHNGIDFVFNQNMYGQNHGIKVVGTYCADEDGQFNLEVLGTFVGIENRSMHLCAFANCEYTGELPVAVYPVAPEKYKVGKRVPLDTVLSWIEDIPGSLTVPMFDVYMDPNETFVMNLNSSTLVSSQQSAFSFAPDLDPGTLYYWQVVPYINGEPNLAAGTQVQSFMTLYDPEHWSGSPWTNDSNSGISVGKVYTHKVNFNASEAASTYVNGVYFENDNNRAGLDWTLAGALGTAGGSHHVAGDGGALVTNIYHGELPLAVLTLTGLMPGTDYVLTQYTRGWGNPGGREVNITTSADGRTTTLDGNILGDGNGYLYRYAYTAPASGELALTFVPLTSDSWHHYAFSNELAVPAYVDPMPLPGASVNYDVQLSWVLNGEVLNPTYNLKVATDAAMTNLVVNQMGTAATAHTPFLDNDTTYYWQVEIVEDGSAVIYTSPVWSFITTPPQPAVKVIEWKFDEITGLIAEQTGPTEDADGILVGFNDPNTPGVSHVIGLVNNGLLLNGKDEYVDISNANVYMPTADGQSFAISGYFRTFDNYGPLFSMRNSADEQPIIDVAVGADGVQNEPGRICLLVRDDQTAAAWTNSGITVNDGRWHHFAVTRVGSKWTLYVDGISRATINGAATGDVSLDMMGIGTSLRWIADGWAMQDATYSAYRDFKGIVDEYTVWDGELQPGQIEALASILPPQGDIDFDLDTDIDDLGELTTEWLASTWTPIQDPHVAVLEDMESYTSDPNSFKAYWAYTPDDYGLITSLSMVSDPNDASNQVMQLDYDMNGKLHTHIPFRLLDRRVNSSLYDRLTMRIRKLPGCESNRLILDFYDGRDKVDPVVEGMYPKGRLEVDFAAAPMDEWVTMDWTIPQTLAFTACTDLYQIMVSLQDGGADVGSVLIDNIELIDETEDCVPVVGAMVPDMNGDCVVNMLDFAELAKGWLNGIE